MTDAEHGGRSGDEALDRYRRMRDFGATPEPAGGQARAGAGARFVIQEHHATSLHWDLRLERDGVLASWAVPKGIPPDPRVNNLAVHTEDHPLEYLTFHGVIPEGNYGAGAMTIWDAGTYECLKWQDDEAKGEVMFVLHGRRARGKHVLFRTGGNQWMLHRMDPPDDPSRELLPKGWRPMRPVDGPLPRGDDWAYEVDWPGRRVVVTVDGGRADAVDADGAEVSDRWPELSDMAKAIGALQVVLDGVLVILDAAGRPDARAVARRTAAGSSSTVRRLADKHPAAFVAVDLLWLDGHATTALPWRTRRRFLDELDLTGATWRTSPVHVGDADLFAGALRAQGLGSVVAKRLTSAYQPGSASADWVRAAVPPG